MLENLKITDVLFLDIETVSGKAEYSELDETFQYLWKHKCKSILRQYDEEIDDKLAAKTYKDKAGIFAEFGKIVCISVGFMHWNKEISKYELKLKSFADDDEVKLLSDFASLVTQYYSNINKHFLCGHNLREFDIPYIGRRMAINMMEIPKMMDLAGKKPWETKQLLDTLELWKFGDFKNYTSLKLLTALFGIPSPKDDIDGSEVGRVYWEEKDLERIAIYCEKDVLAVVQLVLKYKRQNLLEEDQISSVSGFGEG